MFSPLYLKGQHSCGLHVAPCSFALACRKRVRLLTPLCRAREEESNNAGATCEMSGREGERKRAVGREEEGDIAQAGGEPKLPK